MLMVGEKLLFLLTESGTTLSSILLDGLPSAQSWAFSETAYSTELVRILLVRANRCSAMPICNWSDSWTRVFLLQRNVFQILEDIPPTLTDTYNTILREIGGHHRELTLRVLRWLTFAHQPLLISELLEVCAISTENNVTIARELTAEQLLALLPDLTTLESVSPGSDLEMQEDFASAVKLVIFTLFSVKEYLLHEMPDSFDNTLTFLIPILIYSSQAVTLLIFPALTQEKIGGRKVRLRRATP